MKVKFTILAICFLFCAACKETPQEAIQNKTLVTAAAEKSDSKSTFEDLEGRSIELSDYKGKKVLLNFWATWCRPCIEEMPSLLKAEAALKNDNYVFLLASDQSIDKIKTFKEKKRYNFNYLKFNGAFADFKVSALPATFIYDTEGKLVNRIDGSTDWGKPRTIDELKAVN